MITYIVKVYDDRTEWLNEQGQQHRIDGPAVEWADGHKEWRVNGKLRRTDGPAVEYTNGDKYWYLDDKRHRKDGPAIEYANGHKSWWVDDKRHRTDGPAVECVDGDKEWWIDGEKLTEEEFLARTTPTCEGWVVEIDGKKYRLIAEKK